MPLSLYSACALRPRSTVHAESISRTVTNRFMIKIIVKKRSSEKEINVSNAVKGKSSYLVVYRI